MLYHIFEAFLQLESCTEPTAASLCPAIHHWSYLPSLSWYPALHKEISEWPVVYFVPLFWSRNSQSLTAPYYVSISDARLLSTTSHVPHCVAARDSIWIVAQCWICSDCWIDIFPWCLFVKSISPARSAFCEICKWITPSHSTNITSEAARLISQRITSRNAISILYLLV
jgi:hypothetical protein